MVKISKITQSSVDFYFYHEYSLSTILSCKTGDPEGLKPLVGIGKTSTGKISLGTGKKNPSQPNENQTPCSCPVLWESSGSTATACVHSWRRRRNSFTHTLTPDPNFSLLGDFQPCPGLQNPLPLSLHFQSSPRQEPSGNAGPRTETCSWCWRTHIPQSWYSGYSFTL